MKKLKIFFDVLWNEVIREDYIIIIVAGIMAGTI